MPGIFTFKHLQQRIEEYYKLIDQISFQFDNKKLEEILSLFSPNAQYNRAGCLLKGKSEIEGFYRSTGQHEQHGRIGLQGTHSLSEVLSFKDQLIITQGVFAAVDAAPLGFSDFWYVDLDLSLSSVILRQTYLRVGSEYINGNRSCL